jgi:hypothetical protein
MKKIIIRIGIAFAILVVIGLVVAFFSINSIVKTGVQTVGPLLTKVDIKLGAADISPLSGNGRLTKLFVGNPTGFSTPSAIEVGDVKVGVKIGSLLSDVITVNEINIQNPVITLEGGLGSQNNLMQILDNLNSFAGAGKTTNAPPAAKGAAKKFIVKDVQIVGAKVTLAIPGLAGKTITVALPPLQLKHIGVAENGVDASQMLVSILKPLLSSITSSATSAVSNVGGQLKDLGKGGLDQMTGAAKDFFKKKTDSK